MSIISLREAEQKVLSKFLNDKIVSSVDYKNLFVFSLAPKKYNNENGMFIKSLVAVNKNNGKLMGFNPLVNNPKEYSKAVKESAKYY